MSSTATSHLEKIALLTKKELTRIANVSQTQVDTSRMETIAAETISDSMKEYV